MVNYNKNDCLIPDPLCTHQKDTPNILQNSLGPFIPPSRDGYDNWAHYETTRAYLDQGKTYTLSAKTNGSFTNQHGDNRPNNNITLRLCNKERGVEDIVSTTSTAKGTTFTWNRPSGFYFLRVNSYNAKADRKVWDIQLEEGNKATPYVPDETTIRKYPNKYGHIQDKPWTEEQIKSREREFEAYRLDLCQWVQEKCNYNGGIAPEVQQEYNKKLAEYEEKERQYQLDLQRYQDYVKNKQQYDRNIAQYNRDKANYEATKARIEKENAEKDKRNKQKQEDYRVDMIGYEAGHAQYLKLLKEYNEAIDPEKRRQREAQALREAIERVRVSTRMNLFTSSTNTPDGAYTHVSTNGNNFNVEWRMVNTGRIVGTGHVEGSVEYRYVQRDRYIDTYVTAVTIRTVYYDYNPNDTFATQGANFAIYGINGNTLYNRNYDPYQSFRDNLNLRVVLNQQVQVQRTGSTGGRVEIFRTNDTWTYSPTSGTLAVNFTQDSLNVIIPPVYIPDKPKDVPKPTPPVLEKLNPLPTPPGNPPVKPDPVPNPQKPEPPKKPVPVPLRPRPKRPCKRTDCEDCGCENIGSGPEVCEDLLAMVQEKAQYAGLRELRNKYTVNLPNIIRRSVYGVWCVTKNIINQMCHIKDEFKCMNEQTYQLRLEQICLQRQTDKQYERLVEVAETNYRIGLNVRERLRRKLIDDATKKAQAEANKTVKMNLFSQGSRGYSGAYTDVTTNGDQFDISWSMVDGTTVGIGHIKGRVERTFQINSRGVAEAVLTGMTVDRVEYNITGYSQGASVANITIYDRNGGALYSRDYNPYESWSLDVNKRVTFNENVPLQLTGSQQGAVKLLATRDTWIYDPTYGELSVNFTIDKPLPIEEPKLPEINKVLIGKIKYEEREYER